MTKIRTLQILRGTTAQNDAYTGSAGELTMDTTRNELRLHDGTTAGGHKIAGYHPDLFDVKWADHICNDVQWLRADTFSWQSGAVYQAAYAHLADDIDGKTLQSETVGSTTIQFYLADDGHKICPASEESNVTAIYNATGVAWYYIIDTVNTRFKLPRTQFAFTGIRNGVGNFVEAGLPNLVGASTATYLFNNVRNQGGTNGIIKMTQTSTSALASGGGMQGLYNMEIDASWGNSIYGNSTTVQPKATEMYLYFYVGNFTQTALENTAGITTEEMNNKVNIGHEVIEFQEPTAQNNYTWYRKYADGWVEQGGKANQPNSTGDTGVSINISLPVEMADNNYAVLTTGSVIIENGGTGGGWGGMRKASSSTTTTLVITSNRTVSSIVFNWQVSGMAA